MKPALGSQITHPNGSRTQRSAAKLATKRPTRTAIGLWKLGADGIAAGAIKVTDGGVGGCSTTISSRCGLPHLWQNRESGGSSAPHVQYSGIDHYQFAAAARVLASMGPGGSHRIADSRSLRRHARDPEAIIRVMLHLRLKNPIPDSLAHHSPFPHQHPEFPLKPFIEPQTEREFQIVSLPQKDG